EYLIVSKDVLQNLSVQGMKKDRLSDTVCKVLAITPAERSVLEAGTQQLSENFRAWSAEHVQRDEPGGDVVAHYSLQTDAAFSESLSNAFTSQVVGALGAERGKLFVQYAGSWMTDLGMFGGDGTTMVLKRSAGEGDQLNLELKHNGGTMHT